MTVPTEACDASFPFTGVENTFNTGFRAEATGHVKAKFTDGSGNVTQLVNPTHFTVALDPTTKVATLTRVLFPAASGTLYAWRDTPATQDIAFSDLDDFPGETHMLVADRAAMRDAELRRDQAAILTAAEDLPAAVVQAEAAAAAAAADAVQTAADRVQTGLDRVQTGLDAASAAASAALAAANSENPAFSYKWHTSTAASDPGSAYVKGNNADLTLITEIYISETALEGAIGGFLTAMMSSASAVKATLVLLKLTDPTKWVALDVTAHADSGNYRTLTCTNLGAQGPLSLDDELACYLVRSGPPGSGLANVVDDLTPQLGGVLDTNAKQVRLSKGADVASANALTLGDDGNYFNVTGTTAITSIAAKGIGTVVKLRFAGALTLTHHATDLVLPGAADITTAAGDEAEFVEYAAGDWCCTNYSRAAGPVDPAQKMQTDFITGVIKSGANQDWRIIERLEFAITVTKIVVKTASGTITITPKFNATAMTGGAINATSSQQSATPSANNVGAIGDALVLTGSSNASATDISFTIHYTRALS